MKPTFKWDDPILFEDQLTEDERMVRDSVRVMALSMTFWVEASRILRKFSRTRSNMTTDSFTE